MLCRTQGIVLLTIILCLDAKYSHRLYLASAFTFRPSQHQLSNDSPTMPTTSGNMVSTSIQDCPTAPSAHVPNWRVMSKQWEEDYQRNFLARRGVWSEAQYQEALALYDRFVSCQDSYMAGAISSALNCLDHSYRLYGPESVLCSFNGGKDACVILHVVRAAYAHYCRNQNITTITRPRVIYFEHADEFPQVREFLHDTVQSFDLEMIAFQQGTSFVSGLERLVKHNFPSVTFSMTDRPYPMAFVLGTRMTDPNAGQQGAFAPSSHYMPPFMRLNPILEWSYGHVWHFLRQFQLPYCSLYDQGYTSLGTVKDTVPCPALAVAGFDEENPTTSTGIPRYWPAYMLQDYDQERAGRLLPTTSKNDDQNDIEKRRVSYKNTDTASSAAAESSLGNLSAFSEGRFLRKKKSGAGRGEDDEEEGEEQDSVSSETSTSVVSYSANKVQKTVGLLVIGDEILKGLTADANIYAAASAFRKHNVLLKRVVIVSDNFEEIVRDIELLRKEVDVLITSGGVGPTHDDVTIKSVAAALGCELELHEEMAQLLRDKMNTNASEILSIAQTKMATLPCSSKLRYLSDNPSDWPVLQCRNVFVLPGVPQFFSKKIENVAEYLSCQLERSVAYKVVLSVDENAIVPVLNQVVENNPCVSIGSYPFVSHRDYKTVITVEGRLLTTGRKISTVFSRGILSDEGAKIGKQAMDRHVQRALNELITTLPEGSVLRVENDDLLLFD